MLPTTIDAIKAILRADPTVIPADRALIMAAIRNHGRESIKPKAVSLPESRILKRAEVAKRLSCSVRTIDNIAKQGVVQKVTLPGRKRAWGFRLADIERLIASGEKE